MFEFHWLGSLPVGGPWVLESLPQKKKKMIGSLRTAPGVSLKPPPEHIFSPVYIHVLVYTKHVLDTQKKERKAIS